MSSYVGVEFRNGVVYVRQRARARTSDRISDVGHTHIDEVEPLRAGNSAFKAGLSAENGSM